MMDCFFSRIFQGIKVRYFLPSTSCITKKVNKRWAFELENIHFLVAESIDMVKHPKYFVPVGWAETGNW